MNLYQLAEGALTSLEHQDFALEKEIQSIVEKNITTLFNIRAISSEFTVGEFRIDTLCFDDETSSFVIVEYKRGNSYSVIDQGYSYLSIMLNNTAEFVLKYNETQSSPLKRDEIDWSSSRVIFISPSFNTYQKNSVNFRDVPFELWEIKKFAGGLISLDKHQSKSRASIDTISGKKPTSIISQVSSEVSVATEEQHVARLSEVGTEIYSTLRQALEQLPDTSFYATKSYVGCKKDNSVFCYIHFSENHLNVEITRGRISPSGEKSRGFFELDDPKKIASPKTWTHKDGVTGHNYVIKITSVADTDYAMYLIKQKYSIL